jgi:integrase
MGRRKRERSAMWSAEGHPWTYRKPVFIKGSWRVRRRHRGTGEVQQVTLKAGGLQDAQREVQEMAASERQAAEDLKRNPVAVEPQDIQLGPALEAWMKTWEIRPVTLKDYQGSVNQFKAALGEASVVSEISLKQIEALFTERWKDLKGQTKLKYRALLIRAWKYFINHGHARVNLPSMIEIPKKWRQEVQIAREESGQGLTLEEAQALLRAAKEDYLVNFTPEEKRAEDNKLTTYTPPPYLWWLIFISLRSGLRRSNVIAAKGKPGLLWRHLDLEEETINIEADLMKGNRSFVAPMHVELAEELRRLQKSLGKIPGKDEPVVPGTEGVNVTKAFAGACKRAGLGDRNLRIHDLRHAYASWIGATCPRAVEQRLLGHKAQNISDHYARHQEMETLREGINRLPPLLSAPKKKAERKPARGSGKRGA